MPSSPLFAFDEVFEVKANLEKEKRIISAMDILEKLKSQGWYLTEDGLDKLPANCDKSNSAKVIQAALDIDFRDIAYGALPPVEVIRKGENIPGPAVLQIMKIRNISVPKISEYDESKHGNRLLQVDFTDGGNIITALELEPIPSISTNTPPGTKILFKCTKIETMGGVIILKTAEVQVLGGKVAALIEKWEMAKTLQKYARGGRIMGGTTGPPHWTAFGEKIQQHSAADNKNFKSLAPRDKEDKDVKDNNEFNAMRSEAIAEAAKASSKKTFGGGNQQIIDHNVKKILEKGYSEDDAKNALKATRNNLEHALYNLKRRDDSKSKDEFREKSKSLPPGKRGSKEVKKSTQDDLEPSIKPSTNMSLFDFVTDKLPANTELSETAVQLHTNKTSNYQMNSKFETARPERTRSAYDSNSSKPYFNQPLSNRDSHQPSYRDRNQGSNIPNSSGSHQPQSGHPQRSFSYSATIKFENNISSSFASRNSSHSHEDRNFRNNRTGQSRAGRSSDFGGNHGRQFEDNSERYRENSDRYKDSSERYKDSADRYKENADRYKENCRPNNVYNRNDRCSHERNTGSSSLNHAQQSSSSLDNRKSDYRRSEYQHQAQKNGYEKTNRGSFSQQTSRYPQREQSNFHQSGMGRNYSENRQSYHNTTSCANTSSFSNDHSHRMKKLTEDTSKISIDKSRSAPSPRNQNQSNVPSHQQQPSQQLKNPQASQPSAHQQKPLQQQPTQQQPTQQQQPTHQQPTQQQQPTQHQQHTQPQHSLHQQHQSQNQQQLQSQPSQHQPQHQQYTHQSPIVSHHQPHFVGHHPGQTHIRQQQPQVPQQSQQQHSNVPPTNQQPQTTLATQHQSSQSQTNSLQPQHHVISGHSSFATLPNGFTYDPNKIIGFQNKETNEFAMTLLKSQGITAVGTTQPAPITTSQLVTPTVGLAPHPQYVPAASIQLTAQQFTPGTAFVVSQAPPQAAYGMTNENWNWKVGDRCMAKYWDDGRFYEAEITGVSDKTCVVFFSGYGNHEEVLKTDCAPFIIDGPNWSYNYARPSSMPPQSASSVISRGVPNRFRGERQVYVPPPKRES